MKKESLALLLAAPKKDDGGEESGDEGYSDDDDYKSFAEAAFPDQEWDEERLSALKQLVMACMGK